MLLRKILSVFLLLTMLLSLVSCITIQGGSENQNQKDTSGDGTSQNGNGSNNDSEDNKTAGGYEKPEKIVYVYSVKSTKIHRSDCTFAIKIDAEFRKETEDISALLEKGYELCRTCFPPAKDESDTSEDVTEDETNKISRAEATYVINTKSMRFHLLDCRYSKEPLSTNCEYTNLTFDELLALEYIPCGSCQEDAYDDYMDAHPEEK